MISVSEKISEIDYLPPRDTWIELLDVFGQFPRSLTYDLKQSLGDQSDRSFGEKLLAGLSGQCELDFRNCFVDIT